MAEGNSKTPKGTAARKRRAPAKKPPIPPPDELDVDDDDGLERDEREFDSGEVYAGALAAAHGSIRKLYPQEDDQVLFGEAAERYARAVERSHLVMQSWIEEGRPLTELGSMRQPIEHPLMKMIREHEKVVADLAKHVGLEPASRARRVGAGRPTGAASAADRAAPPAVTPPGKARMTRVK